MMYTATRTCTDYLIDWLRKLINCDRRKDWENWWTCSNKRVKRLVFYFEEILYQWVCVVYSTRVLKRIINKIRTIKGEDGKQMWHIISLFRPPPLCYSQHRALFKHMKCKKERKVQIALYLAYPSRVLPLKRWSCCTACASASAWDERWWRGCEAFRRRQTCKFVCITSLKAFTQILRSKIVSNLMNCNH